MVHRFSTYYLVAVNLCTASGPHRKLHEHTAGYHPIASYKGRAYNILLIIAAILTSHGVHAANFRLFGSGSGPQTSVVLRDMTQVDLSNYKGVKTLELDLRWSKTSNISALSSLGALTALYINLDQSQVSDISVLKNLQQLTTLHLVSSEAQLDLRVLKALPELSTLHLDLQGSPIKDLRALTGLPKLTRLTLNLRDSKVTDISVLKDIPNLAALDLTLVKFDTQSEQQKVRPGETPSIRITSVNRTDIGVLGELHHLTSLRLHLIGSFSLSIDMSPLQALQNLTTLQLELENAVADLGVLRALTNLTMLSLNPRVDGNLPTAKAEVSAMVETLNALRNLHALHLDLRRVAFFGGYTNELQKLQAVTSITANLYRVEDLAALSAFKNLTTLNLAMNGEGITSLRSLKALPHLTTLNLDMTRQPDMKNTHWLQELQELPQLTSLTLNLGSNARLFDIGALGQFTNLRHLTLKVNFKITDLDPLQGLKNLTFLNLDLIDNYQINHLNALKGLMNLSMLHLRLPYTEGRTFDISALGALPNLAVLNLDGARVQGNITDIGVLKHLPKLQSLAVHGNLATDGSSLAGCNGLTKLDMKQTGFKLHSLPEHVTDLSIGSYATETDWKTLDLWE